MVCKIVDPGWEQYIVDTKKTKVILGSIMNMGWLCLYEINVLKYNLSINR